MAKLYFRYGAMGCGKTRDIIKVVSKEKNPDMNKSIKLRPGNSDNIPIKNKKCCK